jgi:phosphoribosylanthranilate isomerase
MTVHIKICGLCSAEDVKAAVEAGADAVGFVFWPSSPRVVRPDQVEAWTREWAWNVERVGVFVDAGPVEVLRTAEIARLDIIQLHGGERVREYRNFGGRIWQVRRPWDPPRTGEADDAPDVYVLDSMTAAHPGGTGQALDWKVAADFARAADRPVMLAGGLTPANVAEAVRLVTPWGVDVSTGVESAPGRKDHGKIRDFICRCRTA